jgi:glutamyl-tRNA synthetase
MTETSHLDNQPVRVRFAPSPTGLLHLGGARTALYNYLLAKKTGGQFILRIEDTDRKRLDTSAQAEFISSLKWLGIEWDEGPDVGGDYGPYEQSQRKDIYLKYARELIEKDAAFYCFCTRQELAASREAQQKEKKQPKYMGPCRNLSLDDAKKRVENGEDHVIRFKMPKDGSITVTDKLRGEIVFENKNLDDYILVKTDGWALYHLAALVDDHLMKITHVFRGQEWLGTIPLHSHIYRALGWDEPEWVHLSLFLKPSGKGKMSKRETQDLKLSGKSIFIKDMKELGYLPEAVLNWSALMGWSYDDKMEFFPMEELIDKFSIAKLNPNNAAIDFKKLDHYNGLYMRAMSIEELTDRLLPYFVDAGFDITAEQLMAVTPLIQERMATLDDGPILAGFLFKDEIIPEPEMLIAKKLDASMSLEIAINTKKALSEIDKFTHVGLEQPLRDLAVTMDVKLGQLLGVSRAAVTGQKVSPPLLESMEILGKDKVLFQMEQAINLLTVLKEEGN